MRANKGKVLGAWEQITRIARRMVADGLVVGTAGNLSVRLDDHIVVTPTGVRYEELGLMDWVVIDLKGNQVDGKFRPTSEVPMHLEIYHNTDAQAIVHTHSVHATALTTLVDELPPVHYMTATLGGIVRVAPYATYGTDELAAGVIEALRGRTGCLLKHHGTLTIGDDLATAYDRALHLEWLCQVWLTARSAGEPALLPEAEIERVVEKLRDYGQTVQRRRLRA